MQRHPAPDPVSEALQAAAFGAEPGREALPLPRTAVDSWRRAVALGGRGYYARGRAELRRARMLAGDDTTVVSLLHSTEASWFRQLGRHRLAAERDGVAIASAVCSSGSRRVEATCDALTGLAADALGQGRIAVGKRMLDRCRDVLAAVSAAECVPDRLHIRQHWVAAELELADGAPERALPFARAAQQLAATGPSVRHVVKSALIAAAVTCALGDAPGARAAATEVSRQCRQYGLVPLEWAASMLLAAVMDDAGASVAAACAAEIERRGGRMDST